MDEQTIAFKFPELIDTQEYILFECEYCKTMNGSTIHKDGEILVCVCGNCWKKQDIK